MPDENAQATAGNYIRNTLFLSEVQALDKEEFIMVITSVWGKVIIETNTSGLNLDTKFQTAKDGGDSNLTDWSL